MLQLSTFRHLDMVKITGWSWNWASDLGGGEKVKDLNGFKHGLSISETDDLLRFSTHNHL